MVNKATLCANDITIVSIGKPNQLMELITRVPFSTKAHFAREMTVELSLSFCSLNIAGSWCSLISCSVVHSC